jgi:short-subunit dehydrogenase
MSAPKLVVITGASGGIGAELGRKLAAKGLRVGLIARRKDLLEEVQNQCGGAGTAAIAVADVTNKTAFENALKEITSAFENQPIDVLVNNAGRGCSIKPSEMTIADVEDMMQTNVYSVMHGVQLVLPGMKQRKTGQIVNVSSILGRLSEIAPLRCAYNGAKHFLNAYTEALRAELREEGLSPADKSGIVVSTVSPGPVATDFKLNAKDADATPPSFAQSTESCADAIVKLILNREEECYTDPAWYPRVVAALSAYGKPTTE